MAGVSSLSVSALARFHGRPCEPIAGEVAGIPYSARIAIPDYARRIAEHFGTDPGQLGMPFDFHHFGVVFEFESALELQAYDDQRALDGALRDMVACFGPIILRNAYLPPDKRNQGQRNIFPSLRFHQDRGSTQADHYSLFWRDPFDPTHEMPRTSSTLFVANPVAYLQARKEGDRTQEFKRLYQLFENEDVDPLIGDVVLQQPWRAPPGVGEISVLDNRTVLHASYYARQADKGYPIGVRYLF